MRSVLVLVPLLTAAAVFGNPAMAGKNVLTCDATDITIFQSESLEIMMVTDVIPADSFVAWDSSPNDIVIIFCGNGRLTIGAESDKKVIVMLSPQEGAVIEK